MNKLSIILLSTIALSVTAEKIHPNATMITVTANTKQKTQFWVIDPRISSRVKNCTLGGIIEYNESDLSLASKKENASFCADMQGEGYAKYSKFGYKVSTITNTAGDTFQAPQGFIVVAHNANGWAVCKANEDLDFFTGNKSAKKILGLFHGGQLQCK